MSFLRFFKQHRIFVEEGANPSEQLFRPEGVILTQETVPNIEVALVFAKYLNGSVPEEADANFALHDEQTLRVTVNDGLYWPYVEHFVARELASQYLPPFRLFRELKVHHSKK